MEHASPPIVEGLLATLIFLVIAIYGMLALLVPVFIYRIMRRMTQCRQDLSDILWVLRSGNK